MVKQWVKGWLVVAIALLVSMMVGCGSDSDSDDQSSNPPTKVLTEETGDEIVQLAIDSGYCWGQDDYIAATTNKKVVQILSAVQKQSAPDISESPILKLESDEQIEIIEGSCGGTATIITSIDGNKETYNLEAIEFCDTSFGIKIETNSTGTLIIDESDNTSSSSIIAEGNIKLTELNSTEPTADMTLNVDISMTEQELNEFEVQTCITINTFEITDKIEDQFFTFTGSITNTLEDDGLDYSSETILDLVFTDEDGTVTIKTEEPLVTEGETLISGVIIVTGANNTKGRISVIGENTVKIEVDTNGNGTYNHQSGSVTCAIDY